MWWNWWCSETPCCKTKFAETTQQPNCGLLCSVGSMPRRNEVYYQLYPLALTKKTWLRWERRWRRALKMVRWYPVQEAVIISFPSQHHKLDTNCAVRMTCLWTSMTAKFQLEMILATLHHCLTSLACRICCGVGVSSSHHFMNSHSRLSYHMLPTFLKLLVLKKELHL